MIHVTRFDNAHVVLNSDLIESIEATPDTLLSMTTGKKVLVKESVDQVVERILAFRRAILAGPELRQRPDLHGEHASPEQ